jgi:hypothetical protein
LPFGLVVGLQSSPQPPGLEANHRVKPRVIGRRTAKDLHADPVLLKLVAFAGQFTFDDKAQEAAQPLGNLKVRIGQYRAERLPNLRGRGTRQQVGGFGTGVRKETKTGEIYVRPRIVSAFPQPTHSANLPL